MFQIKSNGLCKSRHYLLPVLKHFIALAWSVFLLCAFPHCQGDPAFPCISQTSNLISVIQWFVLLHIGGWNAKSVSSHFSITICQMGALSCQCIRQQTNTHQLAHDEVKSLSMGCISIEACCFARLWAVLHSDRHIGLFQFCLYQTDFTAFLGGLAVQLILSRCSFSFSLPVLGHGLEKAHRFSSISPSRFLSLFRHLFVFR